MCSIACTRCGMIECQAGLANSNKFIRSPQVNYCLFLSVPSHLVADPGTQHTQQHHQQFKSLIVIVGDYPPFPSNPLIPQPPSTNALNAVLFCRRIHGAIAKSHITMTADRLLTLVGRRKKIPISLGLDSSTTNSISV